MLKKQILTRRNGCLVSALLEDDRLVQIDLEPDREEKSASVGDIFVGKIKDIVPNIQAAFVEIADGQKCYLSLEKLRQPVFLNPKKNEIPHQGDEILVQVSKEAVKTKPADLTVNINITGRFAVLTHGKTIIGISGKIHDEAVRKRLHSLLLPYRNQEYGFILRTSAQAVSEEKILEEVESLIKEYHFIRKKAEHSSCFCCISKAPKHFISELRSMAGNMETADTEERKLEIITDDKAIYQQVLDYFLKFQPENRDRLRLYGDSMISLWNLYGMEGRLEKALRKKVWLPCGGYLVIEPTEALTVIDVNSGKAVGKKRDTEAAYYKINLEAAKEIAVQIRLRNLSGIILVDFIDMRETGHTKDLICRFSDELQRDPVKTDFIDMTALHLAEITRKKVRKPLHEQIQEYHP